MQAASDGEIFERAARDQRVIISADIDFAGLLAARNASDPSVILFRPGAERRPGPQAAVLLANLSALEADLGAGAVVVIEPGRIRIRRLPVS